MIFGLLAGGLLRSDRSPGGKVGRLLVAGLAGLLLGQVLAQAGVGPSRWLWQDQPPPLQQATAIVQLV